MMDPDSLGGLLAAGNAEPAGKTLSMAGIAVYFALTLALIFSFLAAARKDFQTGGVFRSLPGRWSEQLYLFVENMTVGIIGAHGRRYIPFIITLWLVVFTANLISLFFPMALTADLSFNVALALIAIAYVQYEGSRANGLFGHVAHFAGPKLGLLLFPISVMIFMIEVISELMKNVSLSLRLYGNISGGLQASDAISALTKDFLIPAGAFLIPIKLLTVVVQALIFCLLTCVYISLVTGHGHDEDHGHADSPADGHDEARPATAH